MARLVKRLCLPVGHYFKEGETKPTTTYRDIGTVVEFEDRQGNTWQEIQLNLDVLNPVLFHLARNCLDNKASDRARVKLFDVARKTKAADTPEDEAPPPEDEEIPY